MTIKNLQLAAWVQDGCWNGAPANGTIAGITPEVVVRAGREIREGFVLSLGREIDCEIPEHQAQHEIYESSGGAEGYLDWVGLACHGFSVTHLDAVGHSALDGLMYRGVATPDACDDRGLAVNSVTDLASGIITRGVLLDIATVRGVNYLQPGDHVTADDLVSAERAIGVKVEPGDAIFVRTGFNYPGRPPRILGEAREGLGLDAVEWVRDRRVSVYSGDCIERLPSAVPGVPMPLHQLGHVGIGLVILDNPDIELLYRHCIKRKRHTFLISVAALRINRATGSAVNPLAVF